MASAIAAGLMAASAVAQIAPARFPITTEQVVVALESLHLPTENVQVKMAAAVTAAAKDPVFTATAMSLLSEHSARLKIACVDHSECLPFYVFALWPEQSPSISVPIELDSRGGHLKSQADAKQPASAGATATNGIAQKVAKAQPAVRAGMPSTMVIEGDRIHIRLKVVCLQGGATGDKVRVSTPDHKQAYVVEIVTPTLLKGTL